MDVVFIKQKVIYWKNMQI